MRILGINCMNHDAAMAIVDYDKKALAKYYGPHMQNVILRSRMIITLIKTSSMRPKHLARRCRRRANRKEPDQAPLAL